MLFCQRWLQGRAQSCPLCVCCEGFFLLLTRLYCERCLLKGGEENQHDVYFELKTVQYDSSRFQNEHSYIIDTLCVCTVNE